MASDSKDYVLGLEKYPAFTLATQNTKRKFQCQFHIQINGKLENPSERGLCFKILEGVFTVFQLESYSTSQNEAE